MNLCVSLISRTLLFCVLFLFGTKLFSQRTDSIPKKFVVDSISIVGNKKTRHLIILREMNFRQGDSLSELEIKTKTLRSQQNLMNTSLFVFDTVYYKLDTVTQKIK